MKRANGHQLVYIFSICLAWFSACAQNKVSDTALATPLLPTAEPVAQATDIQFVLEDTYTLNDVVTIKIQNVGEVSYYFEKGIGPCNLSFFNDANQKLWHQQQQHCDTFHLDEIKPGDSGPIFIWDLSTCDQPDCVISRPLTPGRYRLIGRFNTSPEFGSEGSEVVAEALIEIVGSTKEPNILPIENSMMINVDEFKPYSANFTPLVLATENLFFAANYYTSNGLSNDWHAYALDTQTGQLKWTLPLVADVKGLTIDEDTIYISSATSLYALNRQNGQVKWSFRNRCCFSTDLTVSDGLVYADHSDGIYAVETRSGQWQYRLDYLGGAIAAGQGLIYVGAGDGLYAFQSQTGHQKWRLFISDFLGYPQGIGTVFPVVLTESIYFRGANSRFYVLDSQTGDVKWEKAMPYSSGAYPGPESHLMRPLAFPPPTVTKEMVYIASGNTLFALNNASGELNWQFQSNGSLLSAPVTAEGYLFVTSEGKLQAFDKQVGQVVWETNPIEARLSEPIMGLNQVFLARSDGVVQALDSQTGHEQWRFQVPCTIAEQDCVGLP